MDLGDIDPIKLPISRALIVIKKLTFNRLKCLISISIVYNVWLIDKKSPWFIIVIL